MSAALFDPDAIMEAVRAAAKASRPATVATLRQTGSECRNVATVARGDALIFVDEVDIEERAGLAADLVPTVYLDAWARLNCQKPASASESEWRLALDDGGRFLDAWGNDAADVGWTSGELVRRDGGPCMAARGRSRRGARGRARADRRRADD
jgi:hypothetical protein